MRGSADDDYAGSYGYRLFTNSTLFAPRLARLTVNHQSTFAAVRLEAWDAPLCAEYPLAVGHQMTSHSDWMMVNPSASEPLRKLANHDNNAYFDS